MDYVYGLFNPRRARSSLVLALELIPATLSPDGRCTVAELTPPTHQRLEVEEEMQLQYFDQASLRSSVEMREKLERALKRMGVLDQTVLRLEKHEKGGSEKAGIHFTEYVGTAGVRVMLQDHPQGHYCLCVLASKRGGDTGKWLAENLKKELRLPESGEEPGSGRVPPPDPPTTQRLPGHGFTKNSVGIALFMRKLRERYPGGTVLKDDARVVLESIVDTKAPGKLLYTLEDKGHLVLQANGTYRIPPEGTALVPQSGIASPPSRKARTGNGAIPLPVDDPTMQPLVKLQGILKEQAERKAVLAGKERKIGELKERAAALMTQADELAAEVEAESATLIGEKDLADVNELLARFQNAEPTTALAAEE